MMKLFYLLKITWVLAANMYLALSFRLENDTSPLVPYEKGFVGHTMDQDISTRTNPGYESSNYFKDADHNRIRSCPSMVGPFEDKKYYCLGRLYGYCDRRSGTCFCNKGYTGNSCEDCVPSFHRIGTLCYPKKRCPNDCSSGAGDCDYFTGTCECMEHRRGDDCSEFNCHQFHKYCTSCDDQGCKECIESYNADKSMKLGHQCETCSRFDPRCNSCNKTSCLGCIDLLLKSIRRSGKRDVDSELPIDETSRELSITTTFGSQQTNAFDEAEHYFVVDRQSNLQESAIACDQVTFLDSSFICHPTIITNVVCGHQGSFSFLSPEYQVSEGDSFVRIIVKRTGGGVGAEKNVTYGIQHITTDDSDFFVTFNTLIFVPHEIQKSFLIPIIDDNKKEGDEQFSVILYETISVLELSNQHSTLITILDNDINTCSGPYLILKDRTMPTGEIPSFEIVPNNCTLSTERRLNNTSDFYIFAKQRFPGNDFFSSRGSVAELHNSRNYICHFKSIKEAGQYRIYGYQTIGGGLIGSYFSDLFLSDQYLIKKKIDSIVNFTWTESSAESARWEGFLKTTISGKYLFFVAGSNVRLWIDGYMIIDEWRTQLGTRLTSASYSLKAHNQYEVVLEVRQLVLNTPVKLMWKVEGNTTEIIPPTSLFYKEQIQGSPVDVTVL